MQGKKTEEGKKTKATLLNRVVKFLGNYGVAIGIVSEPNKARELAELVLKRPIVSDCVLSMKGSGNESWKLATAITSDECLNAIKNIAILDKRVLENALSRELTDKRPNCVTNAQAAAVTLIAVLNSRRALSAAGEAIAAVKTAAPYINLNEVQHKINALLAHGAKTRRFWDGFP